MRRALLVLVALAGVLASGASASAATLPPGAAISDSLEYVGRVPNSSKIVEGKFDTVMGRDVLVTTGRYGFRTYDVRDASHPRLLDSYQPPEILGENGYWQDEDMEIDRRRKLIIGALDPRHDDVDQASCPGIGTLGSKNRNPECRSGFYIISYANPREPASRSATSSSVPAGPHDELRRRLQLRLDGRPGAPRTTSPTSAPSRRVGAVTDARSGSRTSATRPTRRRSPSRSTSAATTARRTTRTTSTSTRTGSRGSAAAAGCSATRRSGRWRDPRTDRVRRATPWDPVLVAGGGLPGGDDGRRPAADGLHPQREPADRRPGPGRRACAKGNIALMTEEDFTGPPATRAAGSSPRTSRARSAARGRRTRRPRSRSG